MKSPRFSWHSQWALVLGALVVGTLIVGTLIVGTLIVGTLILRNLIGVTQRRGLCILVRFLYGVALVTRTGALSTA